MTSASPPQTLQTTHRLGNVTASKQIHKHTKKKIIKKNSAEIIAKLCFCFVYRTPKLYTGLDGGMRKTTQEQLQMWIAGIGGFLPWDCLLDPSCVVLRLMFAQRANEAEPEMSRLFRLISHVFVNFDTNAYCATLLEKKEKETRNR